MKTAAATSPPRSPRSGEAAAGDAGPAAQAAATSTPRLQGHGPGLGAAPRRAPQASAEGPGDGSRRDAALRAIAELAAIVGDRGSHPPPPGAAPAAAVALPSAPPAPAAPAAPRLTTLLSLGQRNAAEFATHYVSEHLAAAPPGARALALADGAESSGAAQWAIDHPHIHSYSADYDYRDAMENVEFWGAAYTRVRIDHTQPLNAAALGEPQAGLSGVLMLRGLCDHCEWKDASGGDAGPVGCAGIPLSPPGIHSLLSGIAPLLSESARFALHGEINFADRQAEHPALAEPIQGRIVEGVERFNQQLGRELAQVHVGESGLVIAGETVGAFTAEELARFGRTTDEYFSQDRAVTCAKYPNERPPPGAAPG